MNQVIKDLLATAKPKIPILKDAERRIYEAGLGLFGCLISEDFFDIPKLPDDKYSTDGLFYEIPYYDSGQLYSADNKRFLLVIHAIHNNLAFCPLSIDFKLDDSQNYAFYVYQQWGPRTIKKEFFSCEDGECYTHYTDYNKLKLSDLLEGYKADK